MTFLIAAAPSTRRAYTRHWRDFTRWCEGRGARPLPASAETCARFLASMAERGLKYSTIKQAMSAISKEHDRADMVSGMHSADVKLVLNQIAEKVGCAQKRAAPILIDHLRTMVAALPSTLIGKRDAALLLVCWSGGFRRSELVALTRADVRITENGLEVFLRRSKTDQGGRGRSIHLAASSTPAMCPARALQEWLDGSGITEGPLFRYVSRHGTVGLAALSGQAVLEAIRRAAQRAGLDADGFSGHSLRAGFVTEAQRLGRNPEAIARHIGHKTTAGLQRYNRLGMHADRLSIEGLL